MAACGKRWAWREDSVRVQYPGHVMNRTDRCEPIFKDDADRALFLESLGQRICVKSLDRPLLKYAELKPYSPGSVPTFGSQLGNWQLPPGQTQLWFYNQGGVIGSSGFN